jgi:nicotinamidase-related amidase
MIAADTSLLVIDVQEKLVPLIPRAGELTRNVAFLIDAARLLGLPVLATEQYPKGLGPTVPELRDKLPERSEKKSFSCAGVPAVVQALRGSARPKVVLAGMETHVCVQQTALDLLSLGFTVYVAADAVAGRFALDHDLALRRLEKAGAIITTAETCVFEWAGGSDHPQFKQLSKLVQDRMKTLPPTQEKPS